MKHKHHHHKSGSVNIITIAAGVAIGGWILDKTTYRKHKQLLINLEKEVKKIEKDNKEIGETLNDILLCNF